jgi:Uma2 family endonuclease
MNGSDPQVRSNIMVAKRDEWMSVEDFLALDRENLDQKYEFVDGKMIAMAGGTVNYGIIIRGFRK